MEFREVAVSGFRGSVGTFRKAAIPGLDVGNFCGFERADATSHILVRGAPRKPVGETRVRVVARCQVRCL